jgi:NAD(P)H dehydrogenase (quinone)
MHVAVVLAHPSPDSFAHELAARAVAGLRAGGHDVELVDLYAVGFRAAMSTDERRAYHGDTPILDPLVQAQADLLQSIETLVVVYPTWWTPGDPEGLA